MVVEQLYQLEDQIFRMAPKIEAAADARKWFIETTICRWALGLMK